MLGLDLGLGKHGPFRLIVGGAHQVRVRAFVRVRARAREAWPVPLDRRWRAPRKVRVIVRVRVRARAAWPLPLDRRWRAPSQG